MSGLPVLVEGRDLRVLVVGGGAVATRKVKQFVSAGALVRIVAPELTEELEALVLERDLAVERRNYASDDIADAQLVVAATSDRLANAQVARDCEAANRLLNGADFSPDGNFAMMAAHHRGPLTVGVSAGGVPAAAVRIRDAIADRFDARYGDALVELSALRAKLVAEGNAALWREQSAKLIDEHFCDTVERGSLSEAIAKWR